MEGVLCYRPRDSRANRNPFFDREASDAAKSQAM